MSIHFPALKQLRLVVEKMKGMSKHCEIAANHDGDLTLRFQTATVSIATHYHELHNVAWSKFDADVCEYVM